MSIQTLSRVLCCALVAMGLLLVGCDSSGSNSDSPEWTGDWRFVQGFDGEPPEIPVYITYTKDFSATYIPTEKGCEILYSDVVGIEGEKVTFEIPESGGPLPGSNVRTERLTVSNDTLTLEVTRANLSDTLARDGDVSKAVALDKDPRQILGCEKSAVGKTEFDLYRRLQ